MRKYSPLRRRLLRLVKASVLPAFALAVFCVYRWAERPAEKSNTILSASKRMVVVRLENAPFTAYADNRKTWSLRAAQIDLERLPGSAFSHIESATLTDIRQGVLYKLPDALPSSIKSRTRSGPETSATYHAQKGRYGLGESEPLAPDLALVFHSAWQFRLEGDVVFRTTSGDELRAPTLTMLEMINNRTKKRERRILCDGGATIQIHGIRIQSNQLRYNPADRTVECLNGVRGTFQAGFVQTERAYWSPTQQTLTCPVTVSGVMQGMPFQAASLTVDIGRRKIYANQLHLDLRMEDEIVK